MADNPFLGRTVVLVAEDEALIRVFTADFLVEAASAVEAIRALETTAEVRALLTNVEMLGDLDGPGDCPGGAEALA